MTDKSAAKHPWEMTITELQTEISLYQMELHHRVLGDPRECVTVHVCCCVVPGMIKNPDCRVQMNIT